MRPVVSAIALLVCAASTALAQQPDGDTRESSLLTTAGISGSIRGAYWSSSRSLDDDEHIAAWAVRLKAAPRLPGPVSFVLDTWAHAVTAGADGDARVRAREAMLKFSAGPVDVRAGRQIIAWGRADGINPTDNLTPRDTTLLLPDDEDERMGTTSAVVTYFKGGLSVTGVWLPEFRAPGFAVPIPPDISVRRDDDRWPGDQWAARLDRSGGAIDWSLSLFNGRDLSPSVATAANGFTIAHRPIRVFGGDAAATLGRVGVRAEAAYVDTDDRDGLDPLVRNPYLHVVAGLDRTWREYLNVNAQYVFRRVTGRLEATHGDPIALINTAIWSESNRIQHGGTLRVAHQWLRETLKGEVAAVVFAEPYALLVRSRAEYAISDRSLVSIGADMMRGDDGSAFGSLRRNSTFLTELRWDF
ncbi:MAG TPA: hypothetical protein VEA16_18625 [Vicinamibacterales bacterium]|nr:hypothetical protein [Vicinamibacterales bacterium]